MTASYTRKLTDADVRQMRSRHATGCWSLPELATAFGVSPITVDRVVSGVSHRWVRPLPVGLTRADLILTTDPAIAMTAAAANAAFQRGYTVGSRRRG